MPRRNTKSSAQPKPTAIRIIDGAVSSQIVCGRTMTIIRGVLMPEFFPALVIPDYQRAAMLNGDKHTDLVAALAPDGYGVPDDLLLCAGTEEYAATGVGEFVISTKSMNVADGHQRLVAALARIDQGLPCQPLGVKLFLDAAEVEGLGIFYQVNHDHTEVASNVHLRNSGTNPIIAALQELAQTDDFPRVQFDQVRRPGDKMTAHKLYEVAIMLHGYHARPLEGMLEALEEMEQTYGTALVTTNVDTFFKVLKRCFGGSDLEQYMYRVGMLRAMAGLFSGYQNFWDAKKPNRLFVNAVDIAKLGQIPRRVVETELSTNSAGRNLERALQRQIEKARQKGLTIRVTEKGV